MSGYNVDLDSSPSFRANLKGWEEIDRADAERSRLLLERIRAEPPAPKPPPGRGRPPSIDADTVQAVRRIRGNGAAMLIELEAVIGLTATSLGQIAVRLSHGRVPEGMTPGAEARMAEILARVQELRAESPPVRAPVPTKKPRPPCPYCGKARRGGMGTPKTCGAQECIEEHWRHQGTRVRR